MDEKNPLLSLAADHINHQYQNLRLGRTVRSVKRVRAAQTDAQLQSACREMESLFLAYLLKEMRATVDKSGFISGGRAEEIFTSLLDGELSQKMADAGGIGLASILLKQLATGPKDGGDAE